MQIELFNRQKWRTKLELGMADHFYNAEWRHNALGYLTPNEFEDLHSPKPLAKLSYVVVH
jgi:transposase InsO family protein